jgi:hypothetical protein
MTIIPVKKLWEDTKPAIPAGQRSGLTAGALENELRRQRQDQLQQLRQFQETMRAKYGELPSSAGEIDEMRQERNAK